MKNIFDKVSFDTSKNTTRKYSTSFSFGIFCLNKKLHSDIYNIYGFVRIADEIVDSFHDYQKKELLDEFKEETYKSIARGISTNPILNSFQYTVNKFNIKKELIDCFLESMYMDLEGRNYDKYSYDKYILGSAEVVGLMCLHVFTNGNEEEYQKLKPYAMKLGSAFQKINFLRDLNADYFQLGRMYFPNIDLESFNACTKQQIEKEIKAEFDEALIGIMKLPKTSRFGVYVAYIYYISLFQKIKASTSAQLLSSRIRIPNYQKISLLAESYFKYTLNLI